MEILSQCYTFLITVIIFPAKASGQDNEHSSLLSIDFPLLSKGPISMALLSDYVQNFALLITTWPIINCLKYLHFQVMRHFLSIGFVCESSLSKSVITALGWCIYCAKGQFQHWPHFIVTTMEKETIWGLLWKQFYII